MVLSKEGAQLSWRRLCFQFSVPLIFPGKAGLVKCLEAAFWENACSLKSLLDHTALMAQVIEHPVTAPFSLSKVLLSFLQFSVQFLNIFQRFREVFVDKKLVR